MYFLPFAVVIGIVINNLYFSLGKSVGTLDKIPDILSPSSLFFS
jgi:hypothetical protein